ncbi:uridine 5'-monophosphate synthase [Frankliniella occidentalis]|uniref:Uridine 5'-monophosphate synthase n=1 Tax=Frankliniella occidentalis TaxID=133901 RepID=A0A6J1SLR5_FRAOC|nr:uridine 5'-monophosphate synthase [Frankliniella occidentalis]
MGKYQERLNALIVKLHEINVLKFGDYKMKIGVNSPVYFDLRIIVSYPKVLAELSDLICEFAQESLKNCDHVCGVPYAALSIATLVAVGSDRSMLVRRKEAKDYGTRRMVEGCYKNGDTCVIVEDVVTSGLSILETVGDLKREGLNVSESIVVVDREQGGAEHLASLGIKMRSLATLTEIMYILRDAGKVNDETVEKVKAYLKQSRVTIPSDRVPTSLATKKIADERLKTTFEARAEKSSNAMSAKILRLIASKQTTLCVAADVSNADKVLELANAVGPYICIFKTHVDALSDFSKKFAQELQQLAKVHNFLIMEDRKFGDIGHTASLQYGAGCFQIADWADLVTVHAIPGPGIIDGLINCLENSKSQLKDRACFIVAEMSSKDTLATGSYQSAAIKLAESREDFVAGIVSQSASGISLPGLVQLTPGVRTSSSQNGKDKNGTSGSGGDGLGQQYNSPDHVVLERGADVAVVGRGITEADNPSDAAKLYRDLLWKAYEQRVAV